MAARMCGCGCVGRLLDPATAAMLQRRQAGRAGGFSLTGNAATRAASVGRRPPASAPQALLPAEGHCGGVASLHSPTQHGLPLGRPWWEEERLSAHGSGGAGRPPRGASPGRGLGIALRRRPRRGRGQRSWDDRTRGVERGRAAGTRDRAIGCGRQRACCDVSPPALASRVGTRADVANAERLLAKSPHRKSDGRFAQPSQGSPWKATPGLLLLAAAEPPSLQGMHARHNASALRSDTLHPWQRPVWARGQQRPAAGTHLVWPSLCVGLSASLPSQGG